MKKVRKPVERMCVGCREMKGKKTMIRVVRTPDGSVEVDFTGKKSGRGAYICNSRECFKKAVKSHALNKALNCEIVPEVLETIQDQFANK